MISERDRCYVAASYQFDPHVELAFERAEKADGVQLMAPIYSRRDGLHIWRATIIETEEENIG